MDLYLLKLLAVLLVAFREGMERDTYFQSALQSAKLGLFPEIPEW